MYIKIYSCPLCGGQARLRKKSRTVIQGAVRRNTFVYCSACDLRGPRVLYDEYDGTDIAESTAINKWNRRPKHDKAQRN